MKLYDNISKMPVVPKCISTLLLFKYRLLWRLIVFLPIQVHYAKRVGQLRCPSLMKTAQMHKEQYLSTYQSIAQIPFLTCPKGALMRYLMQVLTRSTSWEQHCIATDCVFVMNSTHYLMLSIWLHDDSSFWRHLVGNPRALWWILNCFLDPLLCFPDVIRLL